MVSNRALMGLPILLLVPVMARVCLYAAPVTPAFETMLEDSLYSRNGVQVPLRHTFYGIPALDMVLKRIIVGFAQLICFPADPAGYWQLLIFLSDFAGVYGILLFESCRGVYEQSWVRFSFLLAFFGQFITVALLSPIYFFLLYVNSPTSKLRTRSSRSIPPSQALAVLPTVVLAYYTTQLPSLVHHDLESRLWWSWLWQLYPVWGSCTFFALSKCFGSVAVPTQSRTLIKYTVTVFAIVNISTYWYTILSSDIPFLDIMIPKYLIHAPTKVDVALRTVVQYDYLLSFASVAIWLGYSFHDLKTVGATKVSWFTILVTAGGITCLGGFGTALLAGWFWRETILASYSPAERKKA